MAIFRSGQEVTASVWTESYSEGLSFAVFLAFGSSGSATDAPTLTQETCAPYSKLRILFMGICTSVSHSATSSLFQMPSM